MAKDVKKSYLKPTEKKPGVDLCSPDLTRHPPRSPRTRLGGFVHLPRLIDKARAAAAGKQGEFHYNCPMDVHFFSFTGISHEAFMAEVKSGKSDGELLAYAMAHLKPARTASQIASWTRWYESLTPSDPDARAFFNDVHRRNAPLRSDISTWFDWLELDDYVTYGGKP